MKTFHQIQEGLHDPNIFKAFFLAGGPGSGKSYITSRTTGGTGLRIVNSDDAFEILLKRAGLSLKMPPEQEKSRDVVRARAKQIVVAKQENYIEGRLGLVIDGTGRDYDKISANKADLEALGYDTYMIFVNTSLDTALERNANRPRSIPDDILIRSWKSVQANIGRFNSLFKQGMVIVDNNRANEDIEMSAFKEVRRLLRNRVQNARARQWIEMEMELRGITRPPSGF